MSRLAFDDLMKSSSLDPIASLAGTKKQAGDSATEKASSFDDTFKQAVEELQPKQTVAADGDEDPAESKESRPANDPAESEVKDASTVTDRKPSSKSVEESSEPEDPDDVLIAQVMAAASEQEQPVDIEAEDEILLFGGTISETTDLTENLTGEAVPQTVPTNPADVEGSGMLQQDAGETESAPVLASSEIVVPEETETNAEAVQTTVSITADAGATADTATSEATQGAMGGLEATQQVAALQEGTGKQSNTDSGQDSSLGEGEIEKPAAESETTTLATATTAADSASTSQTPSYRGDEIAVIETTDKQELKTETSGKVDTSTDRPASVATEHRSGYTTSATGVQANTEPALDTADRVRFVERVAQAFQAQSSQSGPVRMQLHPEELGSIKIEMTVRNGAMHARVETDTQEARHLLLDNLPALRDRLATQHNIKIEQFDINYNAGGDQQGLPHSPEDWSNQDHHGSSMSDRESTGNTTEETEAIAPSAGRAASLIGSGKQLDVTA